jgi:predicted enzyme related to lactoylglutathione lyase
MDGTTSGGKEEMMDFNSILIGSEDPGRLAAYYSKLFGAPSMEEGGYSGWKIGTGWITVGPHDEVKGQNSQPGRILWNIESSNPKAEFDRLRDAGATVVREPYKPDDNMDMWICTFADPDGNYFQIMSAM